MGKYWYWGQTLSLIRTSPLQSLSWKWHSNVLWKNASTLSTLATIFSTPRNRLPFISIQLPTSWPVKAKLGTRKTSATITTWVRKNVRNREITARGGGWYLKNLVSQKLSIQSLNLLGISEAFLCCLSLKIICISVLHFQTRVSASQQVSDFIIIFTTPTTTNDFEKV